VLQSYLTDHYASRAAACHDYEQFYRQEIASGATRRTRPSPWRACCSSFPTPSCEREHAEDEQALLHIFAAAC